MNTEPDQSLLWRQLADAAYDALVVIDENQRVVLMNARAQALFGGSPIPW